jgi:hypothetical protein
MTNFKPDTDFGPGSFVEDLTPIPRHDFTEANKLHMFPFDEDAATTEPRRNRRLRAARKDWA